MAKFRVAIIRSETRVFTVEAELDAPDTSDTDFSLIGCTDEKARAVL